MRDSKQSGSTSSSEERSATPRALQVFISYSHEDEDQLVALEKHLALLRREGRIEPWHDRKLQPGEEWRGRLDEKLEAADVILLLISSSFIASDYCYDIETRRALERHAQGEARVVPILIRPCDWTSAPFASLQALPRDDRAVTAWPNQDEAWREVARGLRAMLDEPLAAPVVEESPGPAGESDFRSQEETALGARLKSLYRQRKERIREGTAVGDLDREILDLKRRMRKGPVLQQGEILDDGRYELFEVIGQGGFARVWRAWDEGRQCQVALKVLHGQHSDDRSKRERFFRGARKMTELGHPNIVRVLEAHGADSGWHFYVMEYLPGGNLEEAVLEGRLGGEQGLATILEVGEALAHAHHQGVVHRDIKPSNILLDADGRAKLTDFDLVRALDTTGLTRTQQAMGTLLFAAPEALLSGDEATPRADVYSLAAVAAFVLRTERLPSSFFRNPQDVVAKLDVAEEVREVLARALDARPERRFATAGDFLQALRSSLDPPQDTKAPGEPAERDDRAETPGNIARFGKVIFKERHYGLQVMILTSIIGAFLYFYGAAWVSNIFGVPESPRRATSVKRELLRGLRSATQPEWVLIEGGEFQMGSTKGDPDELPVRRVEVASFYLSKTEVTVAQYRACVEAGTCEEPDTAHSCTWGAAGQEQHPINCVRWDQASSYASWVGGRLPSEAEWEFAARSRGQEREYPWGPEAADCERAIVRSEKGGGCGQGGTWPVCSKPSGNTEEGLCDMAGNVWEWVEDDWHGNYRGAPGTGESWIDSPRASDRVVRGGSWWVVPRFVRVAIRSGAEPSLRYDFLGVSRREVLALCILTLWPSARRRHPLRWPRVRQPRGPSRR